VVIGKTFAWGHMGKTGGDATWRLFRCVSDLVGFEHLPEDPEKHQRFTERTDLSGKRLFLNLRRLPSLVLSYVNHAFHYGLDATTPAGTRMTAEEAVVFPRPEQMIRNHTANGCLDIDRWLRMENLREDFVDLVKTIRPVTVAERAEILSVTTKPPMDYDHDPFSFFTREQVVRLYENSPMWAAYEAEVYGNLSLPGARSTATARDLAPQWTVGNG
jgi:hypothetical protein